jgi:hypothetical protein
MDKLLEKKLFDYVYEPHENWTVLPVESPDFLCKKEDNIVLGVEVTELYQSESDARLINKQGYLAELLDHKKYCHKDDIKMFDVGKIAIIDENDVIVNDEVDAVVKKSPNMKDKVKLLSDCIEKKKQKINSYKNTCPTVDLIIHDASNLFQFEEFVDIYFPIYENAKPQILFSGFREIFLVTKRNNGDRIYIPLKINIFASDFINFVKQLEELEVTKDKNSYTLVYCFHLAGYHELELSSNNNYLEIGIGAWWVLYDNGITIRNYQSIPELFPDGEAIKDIVDGISSSEKTLAQDVFDKIDNYNCCDIFFDIKKTDSLS